jgi:hypothetical protein
MGVHHYPKALQRLGVIAQGGPEIHCAGILQRANDDGEPSSGIATRWHC